MARSSAQPRVPAKKSRPAEPKSPTGTAARAIAAAEPTFPKTRDGRTRKPLDPARIAAILDALRTSYPTAVCALNHRNAWELMVATILSAQCTDARVNLTTPELFRLFPTPQTMAAAQPSVVEELIKPTGFFRNKTKSIIGAGRVVTEEFSGVVPKTMEELLRIPGVARKTANVVLGSWFGIAVGVVVDTHVLRLSRRLELTTNDDPVKVEQDLMKVIPQNHWIPFSHELIFHGRQVCLARSPRCADCTLEHLCNSGDKTWSSH